MGDPPDSLRGSPNRRTVTLSPMRRAIARRMVESKASAPHFYISTEIDMDAVLELADRLNEGRERSAKLTVTAFLLRAVTLALDAHPSFNATWDGELLEEWDAINLGVAIALDGGLIAPALMDCRDRSVPALATALRDLAARARSGKLRAPEMTAATFTVSNLGMFDVSAFTAIITPPQVAILATAKTTARPVVRDGSIGIRQVMSATLSCDHRAVDGAGAAEFLSTLKGLLEVPGPWVHLGQ